jgi:hypothetical protein
VFSDSAVICVKDLDYQKAVQTPHVKCGRNFSLCSPVINVADHFSALDEHWWRRNRSQVMAVLCIAVKIHLRSDYTNDTCGVLTDKSCLTQGGKKHERALARLWEELDKIFLGLTEFSDSVELSEYKVEASAGFNEADALCL